MTRVAVITPYKAEDYETLLRCAKSVSNQTVKSDHLWIADGIIPYVSTPCWSRHLQLDKAHNDYGNVARGVGALLAAGERYDAICFLDADNWYEPDHVEVCLKAAAGNPNTDIVFARRRFCRPDGSDMQIAEERNHVDTSCYFFLPGSYPSLAYWALMPKPMTIIGDRAFLQLLQTTTGLTIAKTNKVTVNYLCMWESMYRAIGEEPPPGAKPNVNTAEFEKWRAALSGRELEVACRLAGGRLKP